MHKAERLGWEQTSREWLQNRIRAAIPHTTSAEQLLAYLEAADILVKPRRGPSGDLLGYAVGRPGDLNKDGEQIYHPGGKIAPDLSLPKLKARLETSAPEEHPTARRNRSTAPWHQATDALDTFHTEITGTNADDGGDARAQAHITALGELIEGTAQMAPAGLDLNCERPAEHLPVPSALKYGPKTAPPTLCRQQPATSPTPPPGPTAARSQPWSRHSSGPPSSPDAGMRRKAMPTRPTPPAEPSSTSSQQPTTHSLRRSPNSKLAAPWKRPVAPWRAMYVLPFPNTLSGSSPTAAGPPSPPSWPTPKPEATNPTSSSRKPRPAASSAPPTAPPAS